MDRYTYVQSDIRDFVSDSCQFIMASDVKQKTLKKICNVVFNYYLFLFNLI